MKRERIEASKLAHTAQVLTNYDAGILEQETEYLERRIVELIQERDAYDDRRREAMAKTEEWRVRYQELHGELQQVDASLVEELHSEALAGNSIKEETADEKIPILLKCPAAKRFVSCEPLLGGITIPSEHLHCEGCGYTLRDKAVQMDHDLCRNPTPTLDWVIVGGETGPGSRPMHPDWARSIRDQCQAAGVPFFMKKISGGQQPPEDLMIREFPR